MERTQLVDQLRGCTLLFVASTGGHLAQLVRIADVIGASPDSYWVSFENSQSRSLIGDRRHHFLPYIAPRDKRGVFRAFHSFMSLLKSEAFDGVVSTGAGIALSSHSAAVLRGYDPVYIESVSRFDGPSTTGAILSRVPRVRTWTQHRSWASGRWPYALSVMDAYVPDAQWASVGIRRVFVTLGTIRPYRFDALVDALLRVIPADVEVTWQLGQTTRPELRGTVHQEMSSDEFEAAISMSDLVVTHAGVGTLLQLLDLGVPTMAVPRRVERGEHVDDHQLQAARALAERELISMAEVGDISWARLQDAARHRAVLATQGA